MSRLLIALDDSAGALRAAEYTANLLCGAKDIEIVLVHVLPDLPAIFWDDGHILSEAEKKERQKVVDKWLADRLAALEPVFEKAKAVLTAQGIRGEAIVRKTISDSLDVADSILELARDSRAGTIVLGRYGKKQDGRHLIGSVANKIVHHAPGLAVIIVDEPAAEKR